ncbi:unnamed protein product [Brachionus calyciflorus]|uniref:Uncharacterized protein n=1 Tax=Brachionus calyciflorus TaxID=104777 RepID=A0A813NGR0_9BILA|nr:unnamed protein product [Brachionus calyciflorus]
MDQINEKNPIEELNQISTTENSANPTTNIIWNENEETFLQNLFANTLLSDNFVEKTDFDLGLGFDNLQLNYDPNPSDTSSQLTILSLEDAVLNVQDLKLDPPNFISGSDLLITETKTESSDDQIFKKPSSVLLTPVSTLYQNQIKTKNNETADNLDNNSINKLKRSLKRTKFLSAKNSSQDLIFSKSVPAGKHLKHRQQTITGSNLATNKTLVKLSASSVKNGCTLKLNQHKKMLPKANTTVSSNESVSLKSIDLEKNIFVLKEPSSLDATSNNTSLVIKRDEFDLQIKELSLLDLHSSEDDSSNQDPNKKKNPPPIEFNSNNIHPDSCKNRPNLDKKTDNSNLNISEIITKKLKYTPNTQTDNQLDKSESKETNSLHINPNKHKLDKFIQYFKSLDSSSKEPIVLGQKNSKKSLDSLLSPPSPSNSQKTQNKRKKKDTQQTNVDPNQRPIILISLQSEKTNNNIQTTTTTPQVQSPPQQSNFTMNLENDTLLHMKNLDINTEQTNQNLIMQKSNDTHLNLSDRNSRSYLWNLLKQNSTQEELIENFGSMLHDKISFWDLVQLKLRYSKSNHLKTTYEIIDDYTLLYSNMSALLERFVNEQSNFNSMSDNSSRSRSSSRNIRNARKQSTSGSNR